ncbi:hypothetical protein L1787_08475 [Acuticoccus sp. M5D2P5]|uniref:hypothetical protein n=1 Tax=Acuticoccus kalidii TaxID=2910977 RepID=UPI001F1756A5|nr:hypothetical protein [Acuticoccus kalidii]MCF3933443.1 hypothetical protein [Acuticoccus kalidii]
MSNVALTLACADYGRVMPLATGEVVPDGIDLTLRLGAGGSWPRRAELIAAGLSDPSLAGGEASIGAHLRRVDQGDESFVALPIFPLRGFAGRDIYVRKDGPVKTAADLIGRPFGLYSWFASGSVWYREFLRYAGVPLDSLTWWVGDIERPGETSHAGALPDGVTRAPEGRFLAQMLIDGEIDGMFSPPRPVAYDPENGPIVRLFPDMRAIDKAYYRDRGVYPPLHLVAIRRAVFDANPWVAKSLTEAFTAANAAFMASQRGFPYASPWMEAELDETVALMGEDFHPQGFEANRAAIDIFCEEAFRAGLSSRRLTPEALFADYLAL